MHTCIYAFVLQIQIRQQPNRSILYTRASKEIEIDTYNCANAHAANNSCSIARFPGTVQ